MKKLTLLIVFIFTINFLSAQTGIGTTTPNASAKLDVYSTNKGFLPPRVTLTSATDATTIASPAEGLLVYNLGSVGLQAGYYYWNAANWATIATATSAGNGVSASDMVKLYSKAYSTSVGDIAETNGYSFTVPVSGKYLFDFSSGAYALNVSFSMTFKVRQGTTDIGTDAQTSYNGGTHSEYNGKVEVNLQAGTTYNVYVTSNGVRNSYDYDRVYMKQVAGNLPVTGQTVEYGIARYTGADGAGMSALALVSFDATAAGNLTWSGNKFTLKANKTYELESSLAIYASTPTAGRFQIYDYTNSKSLANGLYLSQGGSGTYYPNANTPMKCIVTPTTDIQVCIKLDGYYGAAPGIIGNTSVVGAYASSNASYFMAQQIGSSAIVNPWVLSGNSAYNTTGNVGIGTSAPDASAQLDLTSTTKGILIPRMTAAQKTAITSPSTGLLIFQTDAPAGFYYYNGSSWLNISNLGTSSRYIPYSSIFALYTTAQSLATGGTYADLISSDLVIEVPSGFSSNRVVLKWDTWGDVTTTNSAHGSFRYKITQSGTSSNTFYNVAMNGWSTSSATTGSLATRFATPVTYIINDLAPGTYTFKLGIVREAEAGTIQGINNYYVAGTGQVFVK
jgi:hypothetical protein